MFLLKQMFEGSDNFDDEFEEDLKKEDLKKITEKFVFKELDDKLAEVLDHQSRTLLKE
jgi:hypothetical protein